MFSLQGSSLAIIISKILSFKIIVRNAEDPIYSSLYAENKIQSFIVLLVKIFVYNFADKIITNSVGSGESLKKILIRNRHIYPIYNPISKTLRRNLEIEEEILIVSWKIGKTKDFHNLIIAFNLIKKEIPNYKLLIVGVAN